MSEINIQVNETSTNRDHHPIRLSSASAMSGNIEYQPLVIRYKKKDGTTGKFNIDFGCSAEDLIIIASCYITFWSFLLGFFTLMLKGALDTDDNQTLLWSFFYFGIFFSALVGASVFVGSKDDARGGNMEIDTKEGEHDGQEASFKI